MEKPSYDDLLDAMTQLVNAARQARSLIICNADLTQADEDADVALQDAYLHAEKLVWQVRGRKGAA